MIASPQPQAMTAEEYLEWESQQAFRHEYCNGKVIAMAGGTKNHDKLAFSLRRALSDRVEQQGYDIAVPEEARYDFSQYSTSHHHESLLFGFASKDCHGL
jgi:Uma2 family endonuclease